MAGGQRRFWNWRDDDLTADINQWLQGLIVSGRFRGYDGVLDATMVLKLNHSDSGAVRVTKDGLWTDKFGVVSTKQGTLIQEYENLEFNVATTASGKHRVDLIIVTHDYEEVVGGEQALYSLIKGVEVDVNEIAETPLLPNEETQVVLGTLYLPSGTTSLNQLGVVYTQAKQPNFANHVDFITIEDGFFITDLDAKDNKIINLANPTESQDAATKYYVDQAILNNIQWATETVRGIAKLISLLDVQNGINGVTQPDHTKIVTLKRFLDAYYLLRATQDETNSNTNDKKFVTPKTLGNRTSLETRAGLAKIATLAQAIAGIDDTTIITPFKLKKAIPIYPIILDIGTWGISGGGPHTITLAHSLASLWNKVVSTDVLIVTDDLAERSKPQIGFIKVDNTNVHLSLVSVDGDFDGNSVNRGHITFWIKENLVANNSLTVNAGADVTIGSIIEEEVDTVEFILDGFVEAIRSTLDIVLWELVSGVAEATIVIADDDNIDTTVTVDKYGEYTFRLTATNNDAETANDTVVMTLVEQVNTAPVINSILHNGIAVQDPTYVHPTESPVLDGWKKATLAINATDEDGDTLTYSIERVASYDPSTETIGAVIPNGKIVFEQSSPNSNSIIIRGMSLDDLTTPSGNGSGTNYFKITADDGNGGTDVQGLKIKVVPASGEDDTFNISSSSDTNTHNRIIEANLIMNPVSQVSSLKVTIVCNTVPQSTFGVSLQIGSGAGQFMSLGTHTINPSLIASSIPFRFEVTDTEPNGTDATATFKAYDSSGNLLDSHIISIDT